MDSLSFNAEGIDVTIRAENGYISEICFMKEEGKQSSDDPLLACARRQICDYLAGRQKEFDLPYQLCGTEFRNKIYEATLLIPYGSKATYAQVAGGKRKARAAGGALGANRLPLLIPCHRVVPSSGGTGGYAGGTALKKRLLELEERNS